jgi:hypothetical protein
MKYNNSRTTTIDAGRGLRLNSHHLHRRHPEQTSASQCPKHHKHVHIILVSATKPILKVVSHPSVKLEDYSELMCLQ